MEAKQLQLLTSKKSAFNKVIYNTFPENVKQLFIQLSRKVLWSGLSCEPNNQLTVYTTSLTEGEVARVKLA